MTDITYPLFPIFAFFGFLLPLIPLRWHLQALNSGTCFFIFWSSLASLNLFINSITWANNAINLAPAWCEISIRIMLGASVGLPASSLCINRRLYLITNVRTASISLAEKRRAVLVDSIICFLFPLIYVALQYIVQGHRFNIFEEVGCYPAIYNTLLAFFINSMWPLLIGSISLVYCCLSLRSFAQRRLEFGQILSANSTLTLGRYFRLMGLAMAEICTTTPFAIFSIWLNATTTPIGPWRSWEDTHFNYSRIQQFPAVVWRQSHLLTIALEFSRWIAPLSSFIFFGFFGFAHESKKNYRLAWNWVAKRLHLSSPVKSQRYKKSFGSKVPALPKSVDTVTVALNSSPDLELKRCGTSYSSFSNAPSEFTSSCTYIGSLPPTPQKCSDDHVTRSDTLVAIPLDFKGVALSRSRTL